mmetsp:Transcript_33091/g.46197  ORF Transcript_33091/g.46197 Transcript_33091/m.46197 type:complete len:186 (-) Transcript_33091:187-744(-)
MAQIRRTIHYLTTNSRPYFNLNPFLKYKNTSWKLLAPRVSTGKSMRYRAFTTNSIRDFATTSSSKEGNVSSSQDDNVLQALGTGARSNERMMIAFTCNVCETRSARMFSKKSYEEGVVIITCPECKSNHLIADRLGWFDDESVDIETIMREKGQEIIHIKDSDGGGSFQLASTPCEEDQKRGNGC